MSNEQDPIKSLADTIRRQIHEDRVDRSRRMSAGLPHLKAALLELREAAALGANGEYFREAQGSLAVYIEQCETDLVRT